MSFLILGHLKSLVCSAICSGYGLLAFLVGNGTISVASPDFCVCCVAGGQRTDAPLMPLSPSYWAEVPGLPVLLLCRLNQCLMYLLKMHSSIITHRCCQHADCGPSCFFLSSFSFCPSSFSCMCSSGSPGLSW